MTMDQTLFRAILAMDAYNNDLGKPIVSLGFETARRLNIDLPPGANDANFSAAAYQLSNGSIVISYRGTDDHWGTNVFDGDLWNGWPGALSPAATQVKLATQFYKT